MENTDSWWQKIDFLVFHVAISLILFFIFRQFGMLDVWPLNEKFHQWDTGWYDNIRVNGYAFSESEQSNSGFFPLFPYLWKWTGFSVFGISLFNTSITIIALILLFREFNFKKSEILLGISIPSMFFLVVPYTESLFFLFTTLCLIGVKRNNLYLLFIGLFLASLTRSTGVFFLPAIGYMVFLSTKPSDIFSATTVSGIVIYLLPIIAGLSIVVIWQWAETGVWFAYFKAQGAFWLREVTLPTFPLSTWNHPDILWVDALAFTIGLFTFCLVVWRLFQWLKSQESSPEERPLHFVEGYLCVVFISILLINPKNVDSGLTEISGANRYIFASSFFYLFLQNLLRGNYPLSKYVYLLIPVIWLLFDSYSMDQLVVFGLLTIYAASFLLIAQKRIATLIWLMYLINMSLQFYLFDLFIRGEWVG